MSDLPTQIIGASVALLILKEVFAFVSGLLAKKNGTGTPEWRLELVIKKLDDIRDELSKIRQSHYDLREFLSTYMRERP